MKELFLVLIGGFLGFINGVIVLTLIIGGKDERKN